METLIQGIIIVWQSYLKVSGSNFNGQLRSMNVNQTKCDRLSVGISDHHSLTVIGITPVEYPSHHICCGSSLPTGFFWHRSYYNQIPSFRCSCCGHCFCQDRLLQDFQHQISATTCSTSPAQSPNPFTISPGQHNQQIHRTSTFSANFGMFGVSEILGPQLYATSINTSTGFQHHWQLLPFLLYRRPQKNPTHVYLQTTLLPF